jgi:hypothetical protein
LTALAANAFLTKQEVREFIFSNDQSEGERTPSELNVLYQLVNSICSAIEKQTNAYMIRRSSLVYYDDGGHEDIFLPHGPLVEVTELVENDVTLTVTTDYVVNVDDEAIIKVSGNFLSGPKIVKVTYTAGYGLQVLTGSEVTSVTGIPEDVRLAALMWIRQAWKAGPENYTPQQGELGGRFSISIARDVRSLLGPYTRVKVA